MMLEIKTMLGLGDNIYQRAFIRILAEQQPLQVRTCWPQLYRDLGVRCVSPGRPGLRTQRKNAERQKYDRPEPVTRRIQGRYRLGNGDTAMGSMARSFNIPVEQAWLDLPPSGVSPLLETKPVAVIRPSTLRREWLNPARSPDPKYLVEATKTLRERGFSVVLVADLEDGVEWLEGTLPDHDHAFLHGELVLEDLLALIQGASLLLGGAGWLVPAGAAAQTPTIIIGGGQGGHNAPWILTDPRCMNLSRLTFILPHNYCRCRNPRHVCPKEIIEFPRKFDEALNKVLS